MASALSVQVFIDDHHKQCARALQVIASCRNEFSGPSLDYMQGYRDGQEYLQRIARAALEHKQDDSSNKEAKQ